MGRRFRFGFLTLAEATRGSEFFFYLEGVEVEERGRGGVEVGTVTGPTGCGRY